MNTPKNMPRHLQPTLETTKVPIQILYKACYCYCKIKAKASFSNLD